MPADSDLIRMMKKHDTGPLDVESAAVVEQQQKQLAVYQENQRPPGQHHHSAPRSRRAPKRARKPAVHWAREREQEEMTDAFALHTPPNMRSVLRSPMQQLGGELISNGNNNIDGVIRQTLPNMHVLRQHPAFTPPFTAGGPALSQLAMPLFQSPVQFAPPLIDATLLNSGTALNMPGSATEQQQQIRLTRYYQQQARINAVSGGAPIAGSSNNNKGNITMVMVDQSTNGNRTSSSSQRMKRPSVSVAPFGKMHPNGYMIQQQQQDQRQQSIVAAQPAAMLMPSSMSRPMMQTQHPFLMHHQPNNGLTPSNGCGHLAPPPAYPITAAQRNPTASAIPVTSSAFTSGTMGYPRFYHAAAAQQQQHQHEAVQRHVGAAAQQQALAAIQATRNGGEFPDAATFASVYEYYLSQQRALAAYSELSVQQHREAPVPYPTAPSEQSKHTQHHRRISPTQPQQVQAVQQQQQPVAHYKRRNRGSGEQIGEHQPAAAERAVQIVTAPMAQRAIRTIETSVPLVNGDNQLQHQRSCSSSSSDTLPLGYGPDDRKFQNFLAEVRLLERQLLMGWSNKLSPGTSNGIAR